MKSLIISCRTIKAEVDKVIEETGCNYPVLYVESGLHNEPEKLKSVLGELLFRTSNVEQVLLVMGYCGNSVMGLKPENFRLIIPRADDCITMLLGSSKRRKEVQNEAATYFFSRGWLDYWEDMEKTMFDEIRRTEEKYGKERANRFMRLAFKHYKRMGVIDTGDFDLEKMMVKARQHAEMMGLNCEVIPGTLNFLRKFLTGPWDDDFIIINPGETIVPEHLYGKEEILQT
ncbi:MAG: DUF1638 domain-containing protein [Clostridiales bacterium]|jgi:hypothetical protein|nr:DUF1638 domain-containing protein [Eubacteriales bacterium]MDH7566379.1 DUF1638 domain-containing protein [Clostridiales bacterium]